MQAIEQLRERVYAAMGRNKWTQADIARRAKLPQSTIKRFLDGQGLLYATAAKIEAAIVREDTGANPQG